eukprot:gene4066-4738_t
MSSNIYFNPVKILQLSAESKIAIPQWLKSIQSTILDLDFFELIKNVSEAVSREEEERVIKAEIAKLKKAFAEQQTDSSMLNKRTGYLTLSLCLPARHELLIMAVNSIMKGLTSTNYMEVCSALTALTKLVDNDTIPAFLPRVLTLLTSSTKPLVRKKCVSALHRFYTAQPDTYVQVAERLRLALCDKDPSVMAASLCFFLDVSADNDTAHTIKDLVPSFVSILKQVAEGRLPIHYVYHGVCHPWLQINILKLLANLGASDPRASEHMHQVILFTMQQASNAVEVAAGNISVMLTNRHNNLRYLGIKALTLLVKVAPKAVAKHQLEVIECLESDDETLKRKSLDLLYRMTNSKNVVPVCAKLLAHLSSSDTLLKAELVRRISELAEKYSPNDYWYIEIIIRLLELEGALVGPGPAYNLLRLVAGGNDEDDEEEDAKIKKHAVTLCLGCMAKRDDTNVRQSELLVKVSSWITAEFGYLMDDRGMLEDVIVNALCDYMDHDFSGDTRAWLLSSLTKLTGQLGKLLPQVGMVARKYVGSRSVLVRQRAIELLELVKHQKRLDEALPVDGYCEDFDMDHFAGAMASYAKQAISQGAKVYIPYQQRKSTPLVDLPLVALSSSTHPSKKELNFAYPEPPSPFASVDTSTPHQVLVPQGNELATISPTPSHDQEIA